MVTRKHLKNYGLIPIVSCEEGSHASIDLKVMNTPIFKITVNEVLKNGVFDCVYILTDITTIKFDDPDLNDTKVKIVYFKSNDFRKQMKAAILEFTQTNNWESDDWITIISPTRPFHNREYFQSLADKISSKKFERILSRTKLLNDFSYENFENEHYLKTDINSEFATAGVFKAYKLSNLTDGSFPNTGFVTVRAHDNVSLRDKVDIDANYSRLRSLIIASKQNYKERALPEKRADYFDVKTDPDGNVRDFLNEVKGRLDFAETEIEEIKCYLRSSTLGHKVEILDIGCGTGVISGEFKYFDTVVTGIEPSRTACDLAEKRIDSVLCGFYEKFTKDFGDEFFDIIIAFHVIEHVENPNHLLNEISRMLKPGGLAVISTPDFEGPMAKRYGENFRLYNDPTHISLFGMAGLLKSIEARSLSVIKIEQPFVETKYFTKENIMRLFGDETVSPPFTGNVMSIYVTK